MRPADAAGFRRAWEVIGRLWDGTVVGIIRDRDARPSLETVLTLRRDRMAVIGKIVSGLTDESLDEDTTPVGTPGWPESRSYRVRDLLLHVLHEEWEHRIYAERDLDALQPHQ